MGPYPHIGTQSHRKSMTAIRNDYSLNGFALEQNIYGDSGHRSLEPSRRARWVGAMAAQDLSLIDFTPHQRQDFVLFVHCSKQIFAN